MESTVQQLSLEFKHCLKELYGRRFAGLVLFGSYARGDWNEESDVDYLVILNDDHVNGGNEVGFLSNVVGDLCLKYNKLVSFLPVSDTRFQKSQSLFYKNVRHEGMVI